MPAGERIVIAVVTRPHGLRGAVRVKVFNPETEALARGAQLGAAKPGETERRALVVARAQPGPGTWVVEFRGVDAIEQAEALRGAELSVTREQLPAPAEGEYYHADLVGCEVRTPRGERIGVVARVIAYPSVDALEVPTERGAPLEIPMVPGIVTDVDITARAIVADVDALAGD
jgi:16S rRNA processing protein RimM